jgi:quercetin dioxygenase-like cupin family protein
MQENYEFMHRISDLPLTPLVLEQNIFSRLLLSKNALVSFIEVPKGPKFPEHTHECEQILIMLEGTEEHMVNGVVYHMKAGDVCVHPAGVVHGGLGSETGYKGIDIFAPPRESHVELMRLYGTYPDEKGGYPEKNNL